MLHEEVSAAFRLLSGRPCFRIYGRATYEPSWQVIDVFAFKSPGLDEPLAAPRRDLHYLDGRRHRRWMGLRRVRIARADRGSRPRGTARWSSAAGGSVRAAAASSDRRRPAKSSPTNAATPAKLVGWESGIGRSALRLTLFREGDRWWNWFENEASATGQFGGIVNGTVVAELMQKLGGGDKTRRPPIG